MTTDAVDALADWCPWMSLGDALAEAPRLPGVYLAREGEVGSIVYVGMAGERNGGNRPQGLRGRLSATSPARAWHPAWARPSLTAPWLTPNGCGHVWSTSKADSSCGRSNGDGPPSSEQTCTFAGPLPMTGHQRRSSSGNASMLSRATCSGIGSDSGRRGSELGLDAEAFDPILVDGVDEGARVGTCPGDGVEVA
jgi:hypothetical protein